MLFFAPNVEATPSEIKPESTQEMITRIAKSYGQDPELVLAIIKCEGEQYRTLGNNTNYDKQDRAWSTDIGLFQINDYYHAKTAEKMGIDIHTDRGNIVYAMWLMQKNGTRDWSASKQCWQKLV